MATPGRGIKPPSVGGGTTGGPEHDPSFIDGDWDAPGGDESPFDRPTIIPTNPPDAQALLETDESAVLLRKDRIAAPRLPNVDGLVPSSSKPRPQTPSGHASLDDEIDIWGGGSRVPGDEQARVTLPTLVEQDPLAFDLSEPGQDDFGLELDLQRPDHMSGRSPDTAPYPLDDWTHEVGDSGVHRRQLPQQRHEKPTTPPPSTLAGMKTADDAGLDLELDMGDLRAQLRRPQPPSAAAPPSPARAVPAPRPSPAEDPLVDMRDRFALGDFSGALIVAEALLESDPSHAEAARCADACRERLRTMYASRLGSLSKVPRVILPPDQVRWLSLDHRAGFVLSCVDGYSTIDEILDVSGMPPLDALRILYELLQQRVIAVG